MSIVLLFITSKQENVFSYGGMIKYNGTTHQTEYAVQPLKYTGKSFLTLGHSKKMNLHNINLEK